MTPNKAPCPQCGVISSVEWRFAGVCGDCWTGYNLCANEQCDHYRCEHFEEGCGNSDCPCAGFVAGSTQRVINITEFEALRKSWDRDKCSRCERSATENLDREALCAACYDSAMFLRTPKWGPSK